MSDVPTCRSLIFRIRDLRLMLKFPLSNEETKQLSDELFKTYTILLKHYNITADQVD